MKEDKSRLLSVRQFAEALGVTQACIRRWLLIRKISHTKIGRLVRVPASEADRVIQEGFVPARGGQRDGQ